ncbi:hypothetical protein SDC9_103305 [bioreactor metagenome]|uniref:Uncharacterized protein n=1 Tax=bioreactor metagenome TaxID=1076179 RepID=A0A645ATT7_9ZZZZ
MKHQFSIFYFELILWKLKRLFNQVNVFVFHFKYLTKSDCKKLDNVSESDF